MEDIQDAIEKKYRIPLPPQKLRVVEVPQQRGVNNCGPAVFAHAMRVAAGVEVSVSWGGDASIKDVVSSLEDDLSRFLTPFMEAAKLRARVARNECAYAAWRVFGASLLEYVVHWPETAA